MSNSSKRRAKKEAARAEHLRQVKHNKELRKQEGYQKKFNKLSPRKQVQFEDTKALMRGFIDDVMQINMNKETIKRIIAGRKAQIQTLKETDPGKYAKLDESLFAAVEPEIAKLDTVIASLLTTAAKIEDAEDNFGKMAVFSDALTPLADAQEAYQKISSAILAADNTFKSQLEPTTPTADVAESDVTFDEPATPENTVAEDAEIETVENPPAPTQNAAE